MEAIALNALWLSPIGAAGVALLMSRRALGVFSIIHGGIQGIVWLILYDLNEKAAVAVRSPWFSMGGEEFFYFISAHPTNLALLLLTIVVGHASLLYGQRYIGRVQEFSALLFLVMGFSQGVFLAKDILLFFIFYEAALVPAFLLIYGWGSPKRKNAAVKFALFTLSGSILFLIGLLIGLREVPSGISDAWYSAQLPPLSWILMSVGLSVKLPLVPLHSWLGDAHVEADTALSMMLAGILLKLGGYALLHWVWVAPTAEEALILRIAGGISLVYAAAVATGQSDLKRMIAFTSIGHMAMVAIGAGAQSVYGLQGAYHQLFTHGIISAGLFAWVGWLEKSFHTRQIDNLHGVLAHRSWKQFQAALLSFGAIGAPGMALFISELMIIWGVANGTNWAWALLPGANIVLTAIYFLRAYRKLAAPPPPTISSTSKAFVQYQFIVWGFIVLSIAVGIYPKIWLELLAHVGG
ncbi:MAG: NADH-quinone oxidoreductase subunit M [Bacteroidia bacterium]|nr:NADH-quinone oxidoreductase subunit M [Bacteroidia bacterium]MDW8416336.1 NADH-quinone oxidoreductase subunit M [Bacteroidia bacterium]